MTNRPNWLTIHPEVNLGYLPEFLDLDDPRPARVQINERYRHGGWHPMAGVTIVPNKSALLYPGDPPFRLLACTMLRTEFVGLYTSSLVAIVQPDGTLEAARVD